MTKATTIGKAAGAAAMAAMLLTGCGSKTTDPMEMVDMLPVQIDKGGRWSMYRTDGTVAYGDEFQKEPTMVINGYFSVAEGEGTYTLYKAGKEKPEAVPGCEGLLGIGAFNEDMVPVVAPGERIKVVDGKGETRFVMEPVEGKEVVMASGMFNDGRLAFIVEGGLAGYYDTSGKVAVEPVYSSAGDFVDGMAIVGKKNDEGATAYSVIDTKGKELFAIPASYSISSSVPVGGYVVTTDANSRVVLFDRKGEEKRMPAKVQGIISVTADGVAVYVGEGYESGLITVDGEELVRAKYDVITPGGDGLFLAKKGKNEWLLINSKGDEKGSFDYARMAYMGRFGYVGGDRTMTFVDLDGKPVSKTAEFSDIGMQPSSGNIKSDYFDVKAVADRIAGMLTDKGIEGYGLGSEPREMFDNPSDYPYRSIVRPENLEMSGWMYRINGILSFSGSVATPSVTAAGGTHYVFDPVKLMNIELDVMCDKALTEEQMTELMKAIESKGFAKAPVNALDKPTGALFYKGTTYLAFYVTNNARQASLVLFDESDNSRMLEAQRVIERINGVQETDGPMGSVDDDDIP